MWTATERGLDDGPGRPSRFFTRIADQLGGVPGRPPVQIGLGTPPGTELPPGARLPVTTREAEAALRRSMVDVRVAPPTRLAALAVLADGENWGLRSPREFAGVLDRGPNDGLIGQNLVLSPTQAQQYEDCPRRYALERRLKVGSDTSLHASFGTLIHDVLETVEKRAVEDGRPRSHSG